jgi:hypothetical protein
MSFALFMTQLQKQFDVVVVKQSMIGKYND